MTVFAWIHTIFTQLIIDFMFWYPLIDNLHYIGTFPINGLMHVRNFWVTKLSYVWHVCIRFNTVPDTTEPTPTTTMSTTLPPSATTSVMLDTTSTGKCVQLTCVFYVRMYVRIRVLSSCIVIFVWSHLQTIFHADVSSSTMPSIMPTSSNIASTPSSSVTTGATDGIYVCQFKCDILMYIKKQPIKVESYQNVNNGALIRVQPRICIMH